MCILDEVLRWPESQVSAHTHSSSCHTPPVLLSPTTVSPKHCYHSYHQEKAQFWQHLNSRAKHQELDPCNMGSPYCQVALLVVLALAQASAFYLPGVAPQDFKKVSQPRGVWVLQLREQIVFWVFGTPATLSIVALLNCSPLASP
jgi:hypothetical protein